MMKKAVFTVFTMLLGLVLEAQNVSGTIQANLKPEVKMHLGAVEGNNIIDLFETKIKPDGSFSFGNIKQPTGLYVLYTTLKSRNFEFIINKEEEIKFNILNSALNKVDVITSEENKLYNVYNTALKKKNIKVSSLNKKLRNPALNQTEKVKIQNQIEVVEKAFFVQTNDQINLAPKSFFAEHILALNANDKTNKSNYFNDLDFTNEKFMRTRIYSHRFREYIFLFSKGDKYGFMDCVDDIMEKAKVNMKIYEFAANEMMTGFYKSGLEEMSSYILSEYIFADDCSDLNLSDVIKLKGQELKNLQVGNYPGNIVMKNAIGQTQDLHKIAKDNKYTIIMFWSSTCHSCEAQIPKVKSIYSEYESKGLEFYGISLDLHKSAWTKALSENRMNWVNVCDFKGWDSPVSELYRIVKTPSYIMLDSSGKIVAKPRHISEIEQILPKFF